jgi:hypothetical protein
MASRKCEAFVFYEQNKQRASLMGVQREGSMKQPNNKQFTVKGHDGRCELYATLSAYEHLNDSVSLVIGDNFDIDESWWKRTITLEAGSGEVEVKEVSLDLKRITPSAHLRRQLRRHGTNASNSQELRQASRYSSTF